MSDLTRGRRLLVLAICCMSLFIVGLDNTIVNVALPSLRRDLHASASGLQWTIDAYTLVLASLLMLGGSTGDRLGRRRVFQTGLVLFTLGSLLCSLAPSLTWLIAFRMVQAVGGSMLNPVAMSIISNTFTDSRERARAIGVWGAVIGVSMALGPVLGGTLVESVSWRAIFWVNVPVGVAALVLAGLFVPESRAARARRFDPVGQALVIAVLAALTYGIIEAPSAGWLAARTLALFAVSAVGAAVLVRYEGRRAEPLLDVRFFRAAPFAGATGIAVFAFAALAGFLFLNTLYLQEVRGYSPLLAGITTLPMAGMTVVSAPIAGRLVASRGARTPLLIAGVTMTAGSVMLTGLGVSTSIPWLVSAYVLVGLGFGMVNAPITNTAVTGMPQSQAGVAAGIASTSRQVGQSLGVAVIGSLAAARVAGRAGVVDPTSAVGWWTIVLCGAGVLLLGAASTGTWARGTAQRTAARLAAGAAGAAGSVADADADARRTPAARDAASARQTEGDGPAAAGPRPGDTQGGGRHRRPVRPAAAGVGGSDERRAGRPVGRQGAFRRRSGVGRAGAAARSRSHGSSGQDGHDEFAPTR
ncbi:MFS transporter [Frankia sp. ACN1ag]|uniref:MFS transporter n=1 Tax=Frankia sp. ACN1ag TaxID=102891 RepID=UPI0006DCDADA|nr:MFS transporter [Frankia sp. ACN1ag]KQC35218.1 MFS transporter [Frankia sp. ACN1ag]